VTLHSRRNTEMQMDDGLELDLQPVDDLCHHPACNDEAIRHLRRQAIGPKGESPDTCTKHYYEYCLWVNEQWDYGEPLALNDWLDAEAAKERER
jgi:hypothetical protein